jgi:hypothetical protein
MKTHSANHLSSKVQESLTVKRRPSAMHTGVDYAGRTSGPDFHAVSAGFARWT